MEAAIPQPLPYAEGDMPHSLRVAVASNTGEALDGHFGACTRFLIYQVSAAEARLIAVRPAGQSGAEGDRTDERADLIADCHVLYVVSIGGPAAAKVVRRGVHPLKTPLGGYAPELLDALRHVLAGTPPPWLAKVLGQTPAPRGWSDDEDAA